MKKVTLAMVLVVVGCGDDDGTDKGYPDAGVDAATGGRSGSTESSGGASTAGGRRGSGGTLSTGGASDASVDAPASEVDAADSSAFDSGTDASSTPSDAAVSMEAATDSAEDSTPGCAGLCVAPAAAGWDGPLLVHEYATSSSAPTCSGDYPTEVGQYFRGLRVQSGSCDCECAVSSSACTVEVWAETNCTPSGSRAFALTPNECIDVSVDGNFISKPLTEQVNCEPHLTANLPTPTLTNGFVLCDGTLDVDGCGDAGLCAAAPSDGELCIIRAGNHACPDGRYTEWRPVMSGFIDNRACSPCTCSGTPTCAGTVQLRVGTTTIGQIPANNQQNCSNGSLDPDRACFAASTFGGTCTASGGELTGSPRGVGPQTLCCLP